MYSQNHHSQSQESESKFFHLEYEIKSTLYSETVLKFNILMSIEVYALVSETGNTIVKTQIRIHSLLYQNYKNI